MRLLRVLLQSCHGGPTMSHEKPSRNWYGDAKLAAKIRAIITAHGQGKHVMSVLQVSAAKFLLAKLCAPIRPIEAAGPGAARITRIERTIIAEAGDADAPSRPGVTDEQRRAEIWVTAQT